MLEDIASYQHDVLTALNQEKTERKKKEMDEKQKGEEMRNSAMETLSSK